MTSEEALPWTLGFPLAGLFAGLVTFFMIFMIYDNRKPKNSPGPSLLAPFFWTWGIFFCEYEHRYREDRRPSFWDRYIGTIALVGLGWAYVSVVMIVTLFLYLVTGLNPWLLLIPVVPLIVATALSLRDHDWRIVVVEKKTGDPR